MKKTEYKKAVKTRQASVGNTKGVVKSGSVYTSKTAKRRMLIPQKRQSKGTRISLSSAQPGDLAFYNDISHVGIVGGKDSSGNILVIHCSSSANNVVITTGGFGFAVRPNCY